MDDDPSQIQQDSEVLFPLSSDFNGSKKNVTYRPPRKDFDGQWGKLKLHAWAEYLQQDPLTATGRRYIAKFNGFETEWKQCESKHDATTPVTTKLFDLGSLYALKGSKHGVYLTWTEGQHRLGAMIQALTGSKIRETDGVIMKPGQLTMSDFINYGLQPADEVDEDFDFQAHVQYALTSNEDATRTFPFLHEVCSINVRWISTINETVPDILKLARQISQAISESKTTSVRKSAFTQIGQLAKQYIQNLSKDATKRRPDTSGTIIRTVPVKKANAAKKEYKQAQERARAEDYDDEKEPNNKFPLEQEAFPSFNYFYDEEYVKYAQDPFDESNAAAVYKHLSFESIMDGTKKIRKPMKPPYANTHKSVAVDPYQTGEGTKSTRLSTWHINSIILFPLIFHHLSAEESNRTLSQTTKDNKIQKLILYAVRYHMASKLMEALSTHGALEFIYEEQMVPNLVKHPMDIIGATFFIVDSINAVLCFVTDGSSTTSGEFKTNRNKAATLIGTTYSTLPIKDGSVRVADIIQVLGKMNSHWTLLNTF